MKEQVGDAVRVSSNEGAHTSGYLPWRAKLTDDNPGVMPPRGGPDQR